MRRLLPDPSDSVDAPVEYAVPSGVPWLRANMVSTLDGAATDVGGLSAGISDPADRQLFKVLRSLADAVVVGARTAETERYNRAALPTVLLTRTLALDLTTPVLADPPRSAETPTIVVAPAGAPVDRQTQLLTHASAVGGIELLLVAGDAGGGGVGGVELDLARALGELHERGYDHLLCEGGPALLTSLIAGHLVDELCLTTTPLVSGGPGSRILRGADPFDAQRWQLAGLYEEDGSLFARWQPRP